MARAARLRAEVLSLRTPDAIHVATAKVAGGDAFVTNDKGLCQVAGLSLRLISDYVD